jgi:ParB-like chromosome segregation protein Spo0J
VAKIVASIRQFGFTTPILAQEDGTIIAGHGRLQAASRLKLERVPVIVARGWTPAQVKAYVITDNKVALDAGWDEEMLKLELGDLAEMGFDMTATGFGEDELDVLFGRVADDVDRDEPEIKPQYQILIECETEADQLRLLEQFQSENVNARALIS